MFTDAEIILFLQNQELRKNHARQLSIMESSNASQSQVISVLKQYLNEVNTQNSTLIEQLKSVHNTAFDLKEEIAIMEDTISVLTAENTSLQAELNRLKASS